MTETKAEYYTGMATRRPEVKRCPDCFHEFGTVVKDGERLLVGQVLMKRFWGECNICGSELIWNKTDRLMRCITDKARAR